VKKTLAIYFDMYRQNTVKCKWKNLKIGKCMIFYLT